MKKDRLLEIARIMADELDEIYIDEDCAISAADMLRDDYGVTDEELEELGFDLSGEEEEDEDEEDDGE